MYQVRRKTTTSKSKKPAFSFPPSLDSSSNTASCQTCSTLPASLRDGPLLVKAKSERTACEPAVTHSHVTCSGTLQTFYTSTRGRHPPLTPLSSCLVPPSIPAPPFTGLTPPSRRAPCNNSQNHYTLHPSFTSRSCFSLFDRAVLLPLG